MTVYLVAYLIILIFSLTLSLHKKDHSGLIVFIAWIICVLIASFRGENVGIDTQSYTYIFKLLQSNAGVSLIHAFGITSTIEIGYLHFAHWISLFSPNQVVFFLVQYAIIYAGLFHYIRKYSVNIPCSLLLFMAISFTSTLNIMRQYLMFAIILYALDFFQNRRWIWAIVLFVGGYLIHRSALLSLPIFVLYFIPYKSKYLLWWVIGSCMFFLICTTPAILYPLLKIFGYSRYAVDTRFRASDSNGFLAYIYLFICFFTLAIYWIRRKCVDEVYAFYLILSTLGAIINLFANKAEIFARAGLNYAFFIVLLIPLVIEKNFSFKTRKLILTIMYGLLLVAVYMTSRSYEYISYFD